GGAVRGAGGGAPAARRPEAGCTRASVARTAASDGRQLSAPEGRVPVVGFGHRKALVGVTTVASEKVRFGSNDDVAPPRIGYAIMSPNGLAGEEQQLREGQQAMAEYEAQLRAMPTRVISVSNRRRERRWL